MGFSGITAVQVENIINVRLMYYVSFYETLKGKGVSEKSLRLHRNIPFEFDFQNHELFPRKNEKQWIFQRSIFYPNLKSFSYDHSTSPFYFCFVLLEIMMKINHFCL